MELSKIRKEYWQKGLDESDVHVDPIKQLGSWIGEAKVSECNEYTAMSLATVGEDGQPSVRVVLLKNIENDGLCFFTNYESRKGKEMFNNRKVAALLFWPELERQVRVEGHIEKLPSAISDTYFHERPFDSQISARVSAQSSVIPNRETLEKQWELEAKEWEGKVVERPPYWGGYKIIPHRFEFWQGRPYRLHDRIEYRFVNNQWHIFRLSP